MGITRPNENLKKSIKTWVKLCEIILCFLSHIMPFLGKNFKKNKEKKDKVKAEKSRNGVSSTSLSRTPDTKVNIRNKEFSNRGGNVIILRSYL